MRSISEILPGNRISSTVRGGGVVGPQWQVPSCRIIILNSSESWNHDKLVMMAAIHQHIVNLCQIQIGCREVIGNGILNSQ